MALSFGFDKIGPIARRAADALLVLNAIAGPDERDAESVLSNDKRASLSGRLDGIPADGLDGLRIGFREESLSEEGFYGKGEDILDHLTRLGAQVTPMTMPETKAADLMVAMIAEAAAHHEQLTLTNRDDELSWQEDAAWPNTFRAIRFLSAVDYVQMQRLRTTVVRSVAPRLESVDAFVAPSFSHDLVAETNLSGHPAITVPVGLGTDKLPEAISVVGPWFGEAGMVRVAAAIEGWSDYLDQRPPV
jgi:Asp-tRNA(Asn)/Glu-tRNA(Gln) amidotransferase A subunit family amidase